MVGGEAKSNKKKEKGRIEADSTCHYIFNGVREIVLVGALNLTKEVSTTTTGNTDVVCWLYQSTYWRYYYSTR